MPHTLANPRPAPVKRFGPKGGKTSKTLNTRFGDNINTLASYNRYDPTQLLGLEFEVEPVDGRWVRARPPINIPSWNSHNDGSLRDEGREYVLKGPMTLPDTLTALSELSGELERVPTVLRTDSSRTSTHVHLNAHDLSPIQVANFACLWYVIEEAYSLTLPESRRGNLFAIRACDTQRGYQNLFREAFGGQPHAFPFSFGESYRYGALNLNALAQFGSLEIRILPGYTEPLDVTPHMMAYLQIHQACQEFSDPRDIISSFSGYGPEGFVRRHMSKMWAFMRDIDENTRYRALYRGMRFAQEIASIRKDWKPSDDAVTNTNVVQPSEPSGVRTSESSWPSPPTQGELYGSYQTRCATELGVRSFRHLTRTDQCIVRDKYTEPRQTSSQQTFYTPRISAAAPGNHGIWTTWDGTQVDPPVDDRQRAIELLDSFEFGSSGTAPPDGE